MFRQALRRCALSQMWVALLLGAALLGPAVGNAQARQQPAPRSGSFATPLVPGMIDSGASAEWVDGGERPMASPAAAGQIFWTQAAATSGTLLSYGAGSQPGIRHMRVGFNTPLTVGTILTRGGDQLSVLRSDARYPGNLADDSQWLSLQNTLLPQSTGEVDKTEYGLWVLPPGTKIRALRFTHDAQPSDKTYNGTVGGVYLLTARYANLAAQAVVTPSANSAAAGLLIDGKENGARPWDNGPDFRHAVSASTPEWMVLSWPQPVASSGLGLLWAGFNAADAQIFTGPEGANVQGAPESDWKAIGQPIELRNQYLRPLAVDWLDFGRAVQTRAIRLRMTAVIDEKIHPHLQGTTRNGNRVWLGEILALSTLGSAELKMPVAQAAQVRTAAGLRPGVATAGVAANPNAPHPPIAVRFHLDAPGYVTLVIEDAEGNRVRNLVSDTYFEAGSNTAWWDGADDLGRNADAAAHGVYLIPTHYVAPGHYIVRGLVHKAIDLH